MDLQLPERKSIIVPKQNSIQDNKAWFKFVSEQLSD
jgi:hypothetical protein